MRTTTHTIFVAMLAIVATTTSPISAQSISAAPVAVLHFDVAVGAEEGSKWADLLTAKISQQTPVVEREKLREILAEQQLTASGFTSPTTAIKLGKLIGAKTLLAAGMYEIGDRHVVALRAVDAETGRALGKTLSAPIRDGQSAVIDRIAETVLESLPAWQQAELPAAVPTRPQLDFSIPAVAVLYFDPTGPVNAEWSWLSTALGDLTINLLASQNTRVISRDNMQTMLRELTLKDPNRDVRRTLEFVKAQRAVHGVYQVSDGRVQIRATLVEAATGNPLHVATVEGPVADVFALHRRATAEILDVLEGRRAGTLDPARLPVWNDDLDAGRTLYRGVESFDKGRYLDAWLLFRRAQQLAPNYPDAVYWAGRMMYYVQEYHQARHELLRFLVGWNGHPRAGDAGLELIHCSQSVGSSEAEVLETLALVAALAPQAEVANFERKGEPTFLAYYADALTAQLHISRRRLRAAAEALGRHLDVVTPDTDLYSHAWSRMYDLRTRHFNETGEWFELPAPPIYTDERWTKRSPGGKHPLNEARPEIDLTTSEPGDTADVRAERPLERLTLAEPSRSYDFRDDPLMIGAGTLGSGRYERHQSIMATFLHYFVAPPGHYLQSLAIDIDGEEIDAGYEFITIHREGGGSLSLAGPAVTRSTTVQQPVADPNRFHYVLGLPPHTRIVGIAPKLQKRSWRDPSTPHGRVVGWRVSAKFTPIPAEPTAALIVRQAADSPIKLLASMPPYSAVLSGFSPQFQPGEYPVRGLLTNVFMPSPFPPSYAAQVMKVEPGATTEVELDFRGTLIHNVNRVHHYYDGSTDLHRFTESHRAGMGRSGDGRTYEFAVSSFCVDRTGRLIAIWSVQRDLYLTISTDGGRTWGPCRLLSLPVNSAHIERNPCLYHGADGRYVLAFNSDRGADRNMALYACWSTDLEEFSAPARISDQGGYAHRIFQRADGTYLLYAMVGGNLRQLGPPIAWTGSGWGVYQSRDLVGWSKPTLVGLSDPAVDFVDDGESFLAFQHQDGTSVRVPNPPPAKSLDTLYLQNYVRIFKSDDGVRFTPLERIKIQEVPMPKTSRDPRCFTVGRLVVQRVGEKLYMYAGGFEGMILRRDGATWTEVLHLPRDFGSTSRNALCLLGADGYIRTTEGPLQWLPVPSTKSGGGVEFAAVPQISATRFGVNLLEPEPQRKATDTLGNDRSPQAKLVVTPFRPRSE